MTKAIGALVAVVTVSILSMAAIAVLLGGFYKGKRKITLDEETDEHGHTCIETGEHGHTLKPVSTIVKLSFIPGGPKKSTPV